MTSVTTQKTDLRLIIHRKVERSLIEHPESAHDVAMGAVRRLSAKMTLRELKQWHQALFAREMMEEQE